MRYFKPGDRVLKTDDHRTGEVATVINYVELMRYVQIRFDSDGAIWDAHPACIKLLREAHAVSPV